MALITAARPALARHNGLIVGEWVTLTVVAAVAATLVETYLLDRKIGLFVGGFLADVYLQSWLHRVAFIVVSLLTDASVLGLIVAFVLWICAILKLRPAGRVLFTLGFALLPVAWFDFVTYQIHQYIGDLFNLGVLFDLSGRSPREFLAVAGPQLAGIVVLLLAGIVAIFGVAWLLNRFIPLIEGDAEQRWSRGRLVAKLALLLLLVGLLGSTGARLNAEAIDRGVMNKASGALLGGFVQFVTDVDRDGYGLLSRPRDPQPFNGAVHPYALEIPGNGIDENGVAGDLPVTRVLPMQDSHAVPVFARRPTVILVILETFRADLMFRKREGREVTPFLNALALAGTFTDRAYSHNGWTQQSRYHIFTGNLVPQRRASSLIDDFNANGYETAFFSAQDESDAGHIDVGFSRATRSYDARQDVNLRFSPSTTPGSLAVPAAVLERRVGEYLEARDTATPLFLHLNLQETHFPYSHAGIAPLFNALRLGRSEITPSRRDQLRATYDNAAANVDAAVARLVDLVQRHTGEPPLVIALADHGESLFDDGLLGHGVALTDNQTRIPLVVSEPGVGIEAPFGQIELRRLVWKLLGAESGPVPGGEMPMGGTKTVFQYMGDVRTPRRLGAVTNRGRITVDLHEARAAVFSEQFVSVGRLDDERRGVVDRLVHYWEALLLATVEPPS